MKAVAGQPERTDMEFFGIGDHGGGPTKENMRSIRQIQKEAGRAAHLLLHARQRILRRWRRSCPPDIQVYSGDLQHHSVGTYTGGSAIKKLNRTTEAALQTAEKFSAIGAVAWGAPYPKTEFAKAWKRVLLLQFHDSMAATTLPDHEETARDGYGRARDIATEALYASRAAARLAGPHHRSGFQVPRRLQSPRLAGASSTSSTTWAGKRERRRGWKMRPARPVPFQWIPASAVVNHRQRLVAQVDMPALGYRQIRVRKAGGG